MAQQPTIHFAIPVPIPLPADDDDANTNAQTYGMPYELFHQFTPDLNWGAAADPQCGAHTDAAGAATSAGSSLPEQHQELASIAPGSSPHNAAGHSSTSAVASPLPPSVPQQQLVQLSTHLSRADTTLIRRLLPDSTPHTHVKRAIAGALLVAGRVSAPASERTYTSVPLRLAQLGEIMRKQDPSITWPSTLRSFLSQDPHVFKVELQGKSTWFVSLNPDALPAHSSGRSAVAASTSGVYSPPALPPSAGGVSPPAAVPPPSSYATALSTPAAVTPSALAASVARRTPVEQALATALPHNCGDVAVKRTVARALLAAASPGLPRHSDYAHNLGQELRRQGVHLTDKLTRTLAANPEVFRISEHGADTLVQLVSEQVLAAAAAAAAAAGGGSSCTTAAPGQGAGNAIETALADVLPAGSSSGGEGPGSTAGTSVALVEPARAVARMLMRAAEAGLPPNTMFTHAIGHALRLAKVAYAGKLKALLEAHPGVFRVYPRGADTLVQLVCPRLLRLAAALPRLLQAAADEAGPAAVGYAVATARHAAFSALAAPGSAATAAAAAAPPAAPLLPPPRAAQQQQQQPMQALLTTALPESTSGAEVLRFVARELLLLGARAAAHTGNGSPRLPSAPSPPWISVSQLGIELGKARITYTSKLKDLLQLHPSVFSVAQRGLDWTVALTPEFAAAGRRIAGAHVEHRGQAPPHNVAAAAAATASTSMGAGSGTAASIGLPSSPPKAALPYKAGGGITHDVFVAFATAWPGKESFRKLWRMAARSLYSGRAVAPDGRPMGLSELSKQLWLNGMRVQLGGTPGEPATQQLLNALRLPGAVGAFELLQGATAVPPSQQAEGAGAGGMAVRLRMDMVRQANSSGINAALDAAWPAATISSQSRCRFLLRACAASLARQPEDQLATGLHTMPLAELARVANVVMAAAAAAAPPAGGSAPDALQLKLDRLAGSGSSSGPVDPTQLGRLLVSEDVHGYLAAWHDLVRGPMAGLRLASLLMEWPEAAVEAAEEAGGAAEVGAAPVGAATVLPQPLGSAKDYIGPELYSSAASCSMSLVSGVTNSSKRTSSSCNSSLLQAAAQGAAAGPAQPPPQLQPPLLPQVQTVQISTACDLPHMAMLQHCYSCARIGLAVKAAGDVPALVALYAPAAQFGAGGGHGACQLPQLRASWPATVYVVDVYSGKVRGAVLLESLRSLLEERGVAKAVHGAHEVLGPLRCALGPGLRVGPLLDTLVPLSLVSVALGGEALAAQPAVLPAPSPSLTSTNTNAGAASNGSGDDARGSSSGGAGSSNSGAWAQLTVQVSALKAKLASVCEGLWPEPARGEVVAALGSKHWDWLMARLQAESGKDSTWLVRPLGESQLKVAVQAAQHLPELWQLLCDALPAAALAGSARLEAA